MTSLLLRTMVLALAWFAGTNAIGSLFAAALASGIRHRAGSPAWVLLLIRLLPASASILFVAVMFLPAQWALEPRDTAETLGLAWYGMAAVGALLLVRSGWRAVAVARASRLVTTGSRPYSGGAADTYKVDALPGVSLAGVVRPRILIGQGIEGQLSRAELDVAIAHEVAHREAFDNLARWCMWCAPDFLGGSAIALRLEHEWHVAAESRADARAICGDETRAVHLASALIKVARLSAMSTERVAVPSWSTLNDSELLEWRVHRLLNGTLPDNRPVLRLRTIAAITAVSLLIAAPVLAESVHLVTEALVALLP